MRISDWSSDVCSSDLKHQQSDANISHLLHLAGNPVSHILSWCVGGPVLETVKKNRGTARTGCWDRHNDNSSPAEPTRLTIGSEWTEAKEGAFRRSCPRLSFGPPIAAQRRPRANEIGRAHV